jgi:hypothetical protein
MNAKVLATCEVKEIKTVEATRENKGLMTFLRVL